MRLFIIALTLAVLRYMFNTTPDAFEVKPMKNNLARNGQIQNDNPFLEVLIASASWSSGNVFVSGAGGQRFKSRAVQIGHSVVNDSPPLQHFFERNCVVHKRNDAEMGAAASLHASA